MIRDIRKVFNEKDHFGDFLGYHLEKIEEGYAETTLTLKEKHLSPAARAHGGVVASLIDFAMGAASCSTLKENELLATIEMKVNFLEVLMVGDAIRANASVLFRGKSTITTEAKVFEGTRLVAVGLGTFKVYPVKP
ncbi:MAG: PaaI family thioesterase [Deltaproteobacteria bacterium]|nr:PaaI family thioesterase [Deltaproteobacteria bacterium]